MLTELRLLNFRCFDGLSLEFDHACNVFIGENAQGKTSILESICILQRLHSPRAKSLRSTVKFDSSGMGVAGLLGDVELQVGYNRGGTKHTVDGEPLERQSEYLQESGLIVWMGNDDIDLIRGSGSVRRRYLDFLCSQLDPRYRQALSRYRRALKARNIVLKSQQPSAQELQAYAVVMASYGDYLIESRKKVVEALGPVVHRAQQAISGKDEPIELEYLCACTGGVEAALQESQESERRQKQCVVGPHRDDLKITLNGMPADEFASEGQQRTLAIALKLAQGDMLYEKLLRSPIYLLDDIFGELDPGRRQALMDYLPSSAQKFITTTSIDWFDGDSQNWAKYMVRDGVVCPAVTGESS
ncbi:DNA replication/repair protein RecF [Rubritalea marina]|uniref:DNA replication/repair protein RecF n=1 Tax=Rubritalea marina TaxID=361055 RepID=UPI00039C7FB6|nr:DNA replication and repair protein RecF [Rubritalea marina]